MKETKILYNGTCKCFLDYSDINNCTLTVYSGILAQPFDEFLRDNNVDIFGLTDENNQYILIGIILNGDIDANAINGLFANLSNVDSICGLENLNISSYNSLSGFFFRI